MKASVWKLNDPEESDQLSLREEVLPHPRER